MGKKAACCAVPRLVLLVPAVCFGLSWIPAPSVALAAGPECQHDADCDDFNPCTTDVCTDDTCFNDVVPDFTPCPDDVFCNGFEICRGGECTEGGLPCKGPAYCDEGNDLCFECLESVDCDENNPCTIGRCEENACVLTAVEDGTDCSDQFFCNGEEVCISGRCAGETSACPGFAGCDEIERSCIVHTDFQWRPALQIIAPGAVIQIGLYAVTADRVSSERISGLDAVLDWDVDALTLLGINDIGTPWSISGFPEGAAGCELNPDWTDGDALYRGLVLTPPVPMATPEGLLVIRFVFRAPVETISAELRLADIPQPTVCDTVIVSGDIPGLDVTGVLPVARIRVTSDPYTPGDANDDGSINLEDFDVLQECTTGSGGGLFPDCRTVDFDLDVDVDLLDFAWFQRTLHESP